MSSGPVKTSAPPANNVGLVGLTLSAIALVGWLIMLAVIFSTPYQAYTQNSQENVVIGLGNFGNYLSRVLVGVVGMLTNGALSMTGTVMSAVTLKYEPRQRYATLGLGLGALGLFIGAGVLFWRALFWFAILNG